MTYFSELAKDNANKREKNILDFWKKNKIFSKSVENNKSGPSFVFYEGPPTTNGKPGIHHILSRVYKDIYIRFYTLQGYHVPRKAGWDCHGLPVEREVEKALGIKNKGEIESKYGLEEFNKRCRESVLSYVSDWNDFSERMAFFIDLENPYFTMDNDYIESTWSLLKKPWKENLLYQGYKVVPYDPILGATMSDAEVDLGYQEVEDPSLFVRFPLSLDKNPLTLPKKTSILVWTTTPWTLASNVALAIHAEENYVLVETNGENKEYIVLAQACLESTFEENSEYSIKKTFLGKALLGYSYKRIFDFLEVSKEDSNKKISQIVSADFVTMDTGTGIVHIAPAYGADDLNIAIQENMPVLHALESDGKYKKDTPYAGLFFKDADKKIIKDLKARALVWKVERYKHKYPFGYRTGIPLLYYAKNAWYIRTTEIKKELQKNNDSINWVPEHLKKGRFGNWLENNRDWALSRERYWGTPLPIWTDGKGNFHLIASRKELAELSGQNLDNIDLHRPYIDTITYQDPKTGHTMRRVPEVIDCWFDSGAMPYSQWPLKEQKESLKKYFPADFISEAIDQTRGWFYTLLAVSTMVSKKSSYKNVVCLGHVLDEKGEKMSKSKGNIVEPWKVFERHGADAIRWYFLTGAPPGNSRRVGEPGSSNDPVNLGHAFVNMFRNSVSFFILYANIDGIEIQKDWKNNPIKGAPSFAKRNDMDRWLLSLLEDLIKNTTLYLKNYDCLRAGKAIESFVDDLSNWYIRRNRRRFWKGKIDSDKLGAYDSLYRCLLNVTFLLAPFVPFLAEEVFQVLLKEPRKKEKEIPESIFLSSWPEPQHSKFYDAPTLEEGELLKQCVYLGRSARMLSKVKIRQPLRSMSLYMKSSEGKKSIEKNKKILLEELNVKELEFIDKSTDIIDYSIKVNLPRVGKRLGAKVRFVQKYTQEKKARDILKNLEVNKNITIEIDKNKKIELSQEDFLIESIPKPETTAVEANGIVLSLDTKLDKDLLAEGLARDLIRNIQELRKESNLEVTDRICLVFFNKMNKLNQALNLFAEYIEGETLSKIVKEANKNKKMFRKKVKINDEEIEFGIWK